MNTVAYASLAFLIVSMLACSFVISRGRTPSRKTGDAIPVLSYIILLDEIASLGIAGVVAPVWTCLCVSSLLV